MTGRGAKPEPTLECAEIHPLCHRHVAGPQPVPKQQSPRSACTTQRPQGPQKCPFWPKMLLLGASEGPGRPNLVPSAPDWPAWVGLMVTTHFDLVSGPFWAPRPKMSLLGTLEVLGGPLGNRFGSNSHRLVRLGWTLGHQTLWPGVVPLLLSWAPRRA